MKRASGDGRDIDPALGAVTGEGAVVQVSRSEGKPARPVTAAPPVSAPGGSPTYYDVPVLQAPVWKWYIPAYFYAGGTEGAAAALGAAAQVVAGGRLRRLVRRTRWIAAGGIAAGSVLLIADLGRPARFINMMRVFRPSSPMNLGTWLLVGAGAASGAAALLEGTRGAWRRLGDAAGLAAGLLGVPVTAYTAVLLVNTAVPVWQGARRTLPPLFVASAITGASGLLDLQAQGRAERRVVTAFGAAGKVAELVTMALLEGELGRRALERARAGLRRGRSGVLRNASTLLTLTSLALSLTAGRSRGRRVAAGIAATAGALCLRLGIVAAGSAAARDPRATFEPQRAALAARTP